AVEKTPGRTREDLEGAGPVRTKLDETKPKPGQLQELPGRPRPWGRGRHEQGRLDKRSDALEHRLVTWERVGISARELCHFPTRRLAVGSHQEVAPIREWSKRRRIPREELQAVPLQLELSDDLRPQQARHIGGCRDLEARPQLLCDTGSSHAIAPLA